MSYSSYILLIPLLPLASFVLLGLGGRHHFKRAAGMIATVLLGVSAALALYTAYRYFSTDVHQPLVVVRYTWLQFSPSLSIEMGVLLDPISVMMLVIVTVVSLMVHLFSIGYMKGEERVSTYFAFLGLFTFSMLGLVLSSNIFQIYIFWELVGLSSYLLIGFYYDRPSAVAAAKKAFIVTRFADLGFLVGILMLSFYTQTLDFHTLIERMAGMHTLTIALVLIFIGGAGKSAMFPLHIWLPDAMEGPTPVSALIHAATMVVAGVYLVARLFPVFAADAVVMHLIAWVGAISAVLAAVMACTQTDIKRVLAYSTMSQIGYMMLALGASGYTASMFHLFTHAFFKSLLFLCAGVIIHAVHSNEIKDMGGLRKGMPLTHMAFLIACLAIAGIPPFSGFFSKEEILSTALGYDKLIYGIALVTSGITAFYMFRLYFSIFWSRETRSVHGEGGASMKIPLVILSAGALLAGFVPFSRFVTPDGRPFASAIHAGAAILPVSLALAGILLAYSLYYRQSERPASIARAFGGLYRAAYRKFYIDEVYLFVTRGVLFNLVAKPIAWTDRHVVDGLVNGTASATARISARIKGLQSGRVQNYLLYFFGGVLALVIIFIYAT